jgi:hypothetical protein
MNPISLMHMVCPKLYDFQHFSWPFLAVLVFFFKIESRILNLSLDLTIFF